MYFRIEFWVLVALIEGVFGIGVNVTVGNLGTVIGLQEETAWTARTIYSFRGIPYAEPPVAELRFQPPVKITSWNGTLWATQNGDACPQASLINATTGGMTEDCLTLNVYVPETADNETALPVIIYLVGGSFMNGNLSEYQPGFLLEEDVILVVPQFRLGPLGLLCLHSEEIPGNAQFLDQVMVMQWVQDNIAYFGGDANRVTLAGQSSGAASTNLHQFSPLSAGLFQQAILMSGSAFSPWVIDRSPVQSAMDLGAYVGCTQTNITELAACYKTLPVETLVSGFYVYEGTLAIAGVKNFGTAKAVIQTAGTQKFLEEEPSALVSRAAYTHMPMLGGATKQEGSYTAAARYRQLLAPYGLQEDTNFLRYNLTESLLDFLGEDDLTGTITNSLEYVHYEEETMGQFDAMVPGIIDIISNFAFKGPVHKMLRINSLLNSTYLYTFSYLGSVSIFGQVANSSFPFDMGVRHSDDLLYLFPILDLTESDQAVARRMVSLWTSFAANGKPTADDTTWNEMSTPVGPYLVIEDEAFERSNFQYEYTISKTEGLVPDDRSAATTPRAQSMMKPRTMRRNRPQTRRG